MSLNDLRLLALRSKTLSLTELFDKGNARALEASVEAGILHMEAGGGARFQSLFFYCNESALLYLSKTYVIVTLSVRFFLH